MEWNDDNERELLSLITDFSVYISSFINKYRVLDYGIDPEDISQEVKIRLWKTLRNDNSIKKPISYIRKVVSTVVLDQFKKIKRDDIIFKLEKTKHISEPALNYTMDRVDCDHVTQSILNIALNQLILSRRTVVKLHLLNMKVEDIAIAFKWSNNKTRNLLYRGLSDLKRKLKYLEGCHEKYKL
jgi:DNA-directed RNA polymerase specialized sigma24 family protein